MLACSISSRIIAVLSALQTPELLKNVKIMEKKKYVTPECVVVELEGPVYMQSGSIEDIEEKPGTGDGFELEGNRHRGEWGNLWK